MLWAQPATKNYIRVEHKLHSISKWLISQVIPQVMLLCFFCLFFFGGLAYLYSAGTQHGNLPPAGWPILFCGPSQEPCVSHSQHKKNRERFWKNAGELTGRVEIDKKKSLAVSVACMAIYWPTPGFKGRTFELCVLTRWDFNFCVRSSPRREFSKMRAKILLAMDSRMTPKADVTATI